MISANSALRQPQVTVVLQGARLEERRRRAENGIRAR
jgi:hypothetical protein